METYLVKGSWGAGRRSRSQYLLTETMPREGRKVLKTGRDEAVVCAVQIKLARKYPSQKTIRDSACSDRVWCLRSHTVWSTVSYFMATFIFCLITVYCLQCRCWKLDESLVVSPSLVSTSRVFPPCCSGERLGSSLFVPCSGSSDVSREGREKIGFVSQHVTPELVEMWVRFPTLFSNPWKKWRTHTGNKPHKANQREKKKHCYFCVNVYWYAFTYMVLKQKINRENLKFIACLSKRKKITLFIVGQCERTPALFWRMTSGTGNLRHNWILFLLRFCSL